MRFFEDIDSERDRINESINKYGHAPEHHYHWYRWAVEEADDKKVFVHWPDGTGLLAQKNKDQWTVISEPLAPDEKKAELIKEFCAETLGEGVKKIWFELKDNERKKLISSSPKSLKINRPVFRLISPIMNMEKFDPELPGGHFKEIRNARNKFFRENEVETTLAKSIDKKILHRIVDQWVEKRKNSDRAWYDRYHLMINDNFHGTDTARVMVVNGQPAGFNAGWKISNSESFYAAVGIHDYSKNNLGLMLYLEDLEWIKKAGYKLADMGGVESGGPLNFKNQFRPASWYKTCTFSVSAL